MDLSLLAEKVSSIIKEEHFIPVTIETDDMIGHLVFHQLYGILWLSILSDNEYTGREMDVDCAYVNGEFKSCECTIDFGRKVKLTKDSFYVVK